MGSGVGPLVGELERGPLIRELEPSDRPALLFMFRRLGERSRHQRFLGVKHELGPLDLRYLTDLDHWHREALIAWTPRPRSPIGVARYVRSIEFDLAEVAVTVVDDWQRHGVGRLLVSELRERAMRAGIRRFTATMLRDNSGAMALARSFGPIAEVQRYGPVVELSGSWQHAPSQRVRRCQTC